jgi:hypothetical protein
MRARDCLPGAVRCGGRRPAPLTAAGVTSVIAAAGASDGTPRRVI